jgi:hypothetical protein
VADVDVGVRPHNRIRRRQHVEQGAKGVAAPQAGLEGVGDGPERGGDPGGEQCGVGLGEHHLDGEVEERAECLSELRKLHAAGEVAEPRLGAEAQPAASVAEDPIAREERTVVLEPDLRAHPAQDVDAAALQEAYLKAGILSARSEDDALHVAIATVARCSLIVSWNFRHIVHFEKIPLYNAVNTLKGYGTIGIFSPLEVFGFGSYIFRLC